MGASLLLKMCHFLSYTKENPKEREEVETKKKANQVAYKPRL